MKKEHFLIIFGSNTADDMAPCMTCHLYYCADDSESGIPNFHDAEGLSAAAI